jgi:uncharacterized membrane protein YkgB
MPTSIDQQAMRVGSIIARLGLFLVLVLIGLLKFTAAEADAIQPLVAHSPLFFWLTPALGVRHTSDLFGTIEIATGTLIACRFFSARLSAVGSAMATLIFLSTVSFIFTTPGGLTPSLGPFLLKDVTLLGAAIWSLGEALEACKTTSVGTVLGNRRDIAVD